MYLYNTLTRKIDEFIPNDGNKVKLYTCGPTVYNFAHIGNLRTYIEEDILEKTLTYLGYEVTRAMNITDVGHLSDDGDYGEDKMIRTAEETQKSVLELAKFYTEAFKNDFEKLHLKWPEIVVPATSMIDTYIKMIQKLMDDDYAYFSNGNVYFDVSKLKQYYVLTNQAADELIVGARDNVADDEGKRNPQDFVLWFTKSKFENHALKWESPWGTGYPGWHIECSGISTTYLGETLDIHCGGVDNIFPHHTNEIAQSESYLGHKWCNHWFHTEHLNMGTEKMAKSSGNFLTLTLLIEQGYLPEMYKLFCLQSHYRKKLPFTYEGLDGAKNTYNKVLNKVRALKTSENDLLDEKRIEEYDNKFKDAIADDLNTPMAMTVLFEILKSEINDASKAVLIRKFDTVLGLGLSDKIGVEDLGNEIDEELKAKVLYMIEERNKFKKEKNYAEADNIRNQLAKMGIELIDTPQGTKYVIKQ